MTGNSPQSPRWRQQGATEQVAFLASSPIRSRILRELRDQRLIERDLRDALDEPRSTVHRNVEKLVERGWIESRRDGYRTTWFGAAVLEEFERTVGNVERARKLRPFFDHVPVEAVDLDALGDVEVTAPRPNRPLAAIDRVQEWFTDPDSIRGFTPYLVPRFADGAHDCVFDDEYDVEVVVANVAAEALVGEYGARLREIIHEEWVSLYRHAGDLPYALLFADDGVLLGAFDADGVPRTVVETDHGEAIEWAEATYRRHRSEATPITAADIGR